MAHTPHTWNANDVITAALLNALEQDLAAAATPAQITTAIAALTNGASTALDTLSEIDAQIATDEGSAAALAALVASKATKAHIVFTQPGIGGVGDGTTDNTAAWNAAMAALDSLNTFGGGALEFPTGVFCISGTTNPVPGGATLVGQGLSYGAPSGSAPEGLAPSRGAVIRATASMARLVQLGRNPTTSAQADTGASMRDLIVDGQDLATATVITAGRRNYVLNCQVYWGSSYAVDFQGQNSYIIGGVYCQNNKGTVVNAAAYYDHKIFDAQIRQPGTTGSCIRTNVNNVLIRGNHMWAGQNGTVAAADSIILVDSGSSAINITGNIIENVAGPEIRLVSGAKAVSITGNQFFNTGTNPDSAYSVIRASGNGSALDDVLISNNSVYCTDPTKRYKAFIEYAGTFSSTNRWVVTSNEGVNVAALSAGTPPRRPSYGENAFSDGAVTTQSSSGGQATFSGTGAATSFTIATDLAGSPATYAVTPASSAAGAAGISWVEVSGMSLVVHTTTAAASGTANVSYVWTASLSGAAVVATAPDTTAPTVPGTPVATAGAGQIALTWTASTDNVAVTGYRIYRSNAPTAAIGSTAGTSYTDTTATPGTAYTYTVDAVDAAGNVSSAKSAASNSATATAGSSNFVSDTFTGAADVLTNHVGETGATWTKNSAAGVSTTRTSGSGTLINSAADTTGTGYYLASGTPASADYTAEADLFVASLVPGDTAGVMVRAQPDTITDYDFRYSVTNGNWSIIKRVAGTATNLGSAAQTLTVGQTYHAKLVASGSTLTGYVNGTQAVTATDTGITAAGKAGVIMGFTTGATTSSTNLQLDNFVAHA